MKVLILCKNMTEILIAAIIILFGLLILSIVILEQQNKTINQAKDHIRRLQYENESLFWDNINRSGIFAESKEDEEKIH